VVEYSIVEYDKAAPDSIEGWAAAGGEDNGEIKWLAWKKREGGGGENETGSIERAIGFRK